MNILIVFIYYLSLGLDNMYDNTFKKIYPTKRWLQICNSSNRTNIFNN